MECTTKRWPPTYDFESLQDQIIYLINNDLQTDFYNAYLNNDDFFQGDIIEMKNVFPFIDENGDIAVNEASLWIILGNTCDIARDDLPFTNIIPLEKIDTDIPKKLLSGLMQYQNYKKVYLPGTGDDSLGYIADFTQVCSIDKNYLIKHTVKLHELTYTAWVLFHSCIVRYFARDDGRND